MVARMMANGVGGADADKLKALIVEFAPELEALGVKVDGFDARLSKLEKGLGGWKISGQMRFDFRSDHDKKSMEYKYVKDKEDGFDYRKKDEHGFKFQRYRLMFAKELSDGVSFNMRWNNGKFDRWWVEAKDFLGAQGLSYRAGAFYVDWEGPDNMYNNNLYWDDDANFLDGTMRGVEVSYNRGGFELTGLAGDFGGVDGSFTNKEVYGARLRFGGEKFWISANGLFMNGVKTGYTLADLPGKDSKAYADASAYFDENDINMKAYWFALGFRPFKGVTLNGAYYLEKVDAWGVNGEGKTHVDTSKWNDDPKAWKIVLDLDYSLLKFTNLRFEYGKYDDGFFVQNGTGWMAISGADLNSAGAFMANDTKFLKVSAIQKLGSKFSLYERYVEYKQDDVDDVLDGDGNKMVGGKAKEFQVGLHYQYTPNLAFVLDYTKMDGQMKWGGVFKDAEDKVIRFRTFLSF